MKRSRLLASVENKQLASRNLLRSLPVSEHTLFYCGDGWADDESDSRQPEEIKQIDAVVKIANEASAVTLYAEKALGTAEDNQKF